ncbi:hypothetical protein Slala02_51900 [Streptomyces lavendulae subsp. lavendulae]|nr:hypothetical protein Slala01_23510 [Streptomyces lavendulae subsp. lavendulae]GLX29370.1 hypothetical protein Slala02_51900 [Streptomyces lavendulae subsp. lavendulae]
MPAAARAAPAEAARAALAATPAAAAGSADAAVTTRSTAVSDVPPAPVESSVLVAVVSMPSPQAQDAHCSGRVRSCSEALWRVARN